MIIIGPDDLWPVDVYMNGSQTEPRERGIGRIVQDGRCYFYEQTGRQPTHVLLGRNAMDRLSEEYGCPRYASGLFEPTCCGLALREMAFRNGVELL